MLVASFCISGFSQTPYLDSIQLVIQNSSGLEKYISSYRYCHTLMMIDTAKSSQRLARLEIDTKDSDLSSSDKHYVLGILGEVKFHRERIKGDYEKGLFYLQEIYDHSKQVEDKRKYLLQGITYNFRGVIYTFQGLFEKSNTELLKAVEVIELSNRPHMTANCYYQISQNYQKLEKNDSVIYFCDLALDIVSQNKSSSHQYSYTSLKAKAYNNLELPDSTIAMLPEEFLNQCKSTSIIVYAHLCLRLADAYMLKKKFHQAQQLINNAKEITETTDEPELDHQLLYAQYQLSLLTKDYYSAHQSLLDYENFGDSLYQSKMEAELLNLQMKYESQTKDFQILSLETENNYQSNMMKLGGSLFAIILGTLYFWFRNREEKIKAIQAKNNQQIQVAFKYNDTTPEIEDDFLKNIIQCIQENLTNEKFSVDDLVKHSGMNRNAMNKKLKTLTNKTAVKLIREIRLNKAKSLLLKNGKNVSEIAFEVGFKDPNYFSVCFKEQFGMTPSDVLKKAVNH